MELVVSYDFPSQTLEGTLSKVAENFDIFLSFSITGPQTYRVENIETKKGPSFSFGSKVTEDFSTDSAGI